MNILRYEKYINRKYFLKRLDETPIEKNMWNEYHFGPSGSGKTHVYSKLCEKYSEDDVYLCNDYANSSSSGGGWDYYSNNPSKIVVLDEFRGNIPYANLLSIMDIYSRNQQHSRYQNIYCLWTSVIICSIFPPEKVYELMVKESERTEDSIRQFYRRLNAIVYHWKGKDGHFRTYSVSPEKYSGADWIKMDASEFEDKFSYEEFMKSKQDCISKAAEFGAEISLGGDIVDD